MEGSTNEVIDFVMETSFQNLPEEVIHESKRLLIDSTGSGIAALQTDKGRYGIGLAKMLGGPAESRIIGTNEYVSSPNAAFANGELINALDYDAFIYPTHAPPIIIPPSLGIGERNEASGKDLILSIALGCELSIRIGLSIRGKKKAFSSKSGEETGKITGTKFSVSVVGIPVMAGTLGIGRMLKFDRKKMSNLMGLGAHFTPFPQAKWKVGTSIPMTKYISTGWAAHSVVCAVLLAQMGYTGDTTVLDGDLGFWRFFGGTNSDPEAISKDLGRDWEMIGSVEYKPYPCCRPFHVALDCFIRIRDENNLEAEKIESVTVISSPILTNPFYLKKNITDHIAAQFSLPYVISAAALKINTAEWQNPEYIRSIEINNFMRKVHQKNHPDYEKVMLREPGSDLTKVEVVTERGTFTSEAKYAKGHPHLESARMSDDDLLSKFKSNTSKVLSNHKVNEAIKTILNLEDIKSIDEIMNLLTP
jgi:2-methylcitrate dehydratase PrpD